MKQSPNYYITKIIVELFSFFNPMRTKTHMYAWVTQYTFLPMVTHYSTYPQVMVMHQETFADKGREASKHG